MEDAPIRVTLDKRTPSAVLDWVNPCYSHSSKPDWSVLHLNNAVRFACDLLDKTNVGIFLKRPVMDRIEPFRIERKLFSSFLVVIQARYMTGQVVHIFGTKKLYSLFTKIARDHSRSRNDRGNSQRDVLQKFCGKNAIGEHIAPVGHNTDIDGSNEFRKSGRG